MECIRQGAAFVRNMNKTKSTTQNRHKSSIFGWYTAFDNYSSYLAGENQTGGDIRVVSTVTSCRFFAATERLNQLNRLLHKGLLV